MPAALYFNLHRNSKVKQNESDKLIEVTLL